MKPIYIFASRLRALWVLLPMSIVLTIALRVNNGAEGSLKLYPLIIFSIGSIIFTFVYYFRFVAISFSEIKYIGRFSSRDSASINEGKTLVIELMEKSRISIRLYGNEGYNPEIKWLTNEKGESGDICLFRGRVYGGSGIASRILTHLGVDTADVGTILDTDGFKRTYENVSVSTLTENEHKLIKIRFDKTV